MKYLPLAKYKYAVSNGDDPRIIAENEYNARLDNYAVQKTFLYPLLTYRDESQTSKYPIFFLPLPKILTLADQFRFNSKTINHIASQLPPLAISQFLNSLLVSEIFYTNDIEGVKTNKIEIGTVIQENNLLASQRGKSSEKRLGSTINLYQQTQYGKPIYIQTLADFRRIYDTLLKGELAADRQPNGKIFRDRLANGELLTISSSTKVVHRPPADEEKIQQAMSSVIKFMNDESMPALYKALITHFFFENTHPFLDGNGRMGRYLLSTYLSSKYDRFTGFSVATAILAHIQQYYKDFIVADNAENYADLTLFIQSLLEILTSQQQENIATLNQLKALLNDAEQTISKWIQEHSAKFPTTLSPQLIQQTLSYLAQSKLFSYAPSLGIKDNEIIRNNKDNGFAMAKTRRTLDFLEDCGIIKLIAKKPKQHEITLI